jgi:hypothetical protein
MLHGPIHHEVVAMLLTERWTPEEERRAQALATLDASAEPRRRRFRCAVRGSRPAACAQPTCACLTA